MMFTNEFISRPKGVSATSKNSKMRIIKIRMAKASKGLQANF